MPPPPPPPPPPRGGGGGGGGPGGGAGGGGAGGGGRGAKDLPGAPDVALLGPDVPDREPQGVPAAEDRVGEEDLAGGVHRLEQALVERVQPGIVGRPPAGAE